MKYFITSIRFTVFMTIVLGLIYPLAMTGIAQLVFPAQANGNFEVIDGKTVGSILISQKFEKPEYFWPRPSAVDYNPMLSGGSNQGQQSSDLKKIVEDRRAKLKSANSEQTEDPPQDLLFASGSGLDPHISIEAVNYQIQRVAKARNIDPTQIQQLVQTLTEHRALGILGEPKINVLALNLALDKMN